MAARGGDTWLGKWMVWNTFLPASLLPADGEYSGRLVLHPALNPAGGARLGPRGNSTRTSIRRSRAPGSGFKASFRKRCELTYEVRQGNPDHPDLDRFSTAQLYLSRLEGERQGCDNWLDWLGWLGWLGWQKA